MNVYCTNCGCVSYRVGCVDNGCVDCGSEALLTEQAAALELMKNHIWKTLPEETRQQLKPMDIVHFAEAVGPFLNIQEAILNGPLGTAANGGANASRSQAMSEDIIRKAVELADGFTRTGLGGLYIHVDVADTKFPYHIQCELENPPQLVLDALAAQLVRQVDALDNQPITVVSYPDVTQVFHLRTAKDEMIAYHGGDGRTLNTLKAIVGSRAFVFEPSVEATLFVRE